MCEKILIENCSPTLAGLKTANLINVEYESLEAARDDIREMNRIFVRKGLRAVPLRYSGKRALIYIYRPDRLRRDISHKTPMELLPKMGYRCDNICSCVAHLASRVRECGDFPHEIGFFLGYPPEDVVGFMTHKEEGCKLVGLWKVYGDAEAARRQFEKCRKCCEVYRSEWKRGRSIEDLTVRTRPVQ